MTTVSARRFLPEIEVRLPHILPFASYGEMTPEANAAWNAPFGPADEFDLDVRNTAFDGPHGPVPVRVYTPRTPAPAGGRPALVWSHGGAFFFGNLDMPEADVTSRAVAGRADAVVISVDYRLCPNPFAGETGPNAVRFPIPHDDVLAAFDGVHAAAEELGIDPARIAIGGSSAGANLAAGVALRLSEEGRTPWQMLLIFGVFHSPLPKPSPELAEALAIVPPALGGTPKADGPGPIELNYYGDLGPVPHAMPGHASDLSVMPPAYLESDEFDALRASGELFALQLREAGITVEERLVPGVPHGHLNWIGLSECTKTHEAMATRLRRA
ncbi:MAG: alpha/beta hydrolase [Promicromonosporaceae bacterium]|nr:alpha/beta hydrolase [Promicromonosporaceae bacterium]